MSARRRTEDEPKTSAAEVKAAREAMAAPEGGRYKTPDGRTVDAWGDEVKDTPKAAKADD
jgi:dipeptidyl aminopeptidase/acylaminoacyl peptidase